ncbi:hypothetical protein PR202_gb17132 [Eleusine coracana subsp. coracana]|uniref:RING-type E3 ubiquitin transferase n=1 Tax=Eleusine coracana subsp. coracana TaxID=191504 RepID=A0AAV5F248_ELECO|nr:hypothetical protein PR202_gb17132 [Eleusine coracana subsp. coracana]
MIRLQTYAAFSLLATASAMYYAFSSREQFYPAMVYLSTSKICFVLLLNTGLVAMCAAWQLVKRVFLGSLREAEVERLNEQSWREVVEILFAVTIFRQDFSVAFLTMVAALLLVKALHWLAQKRVEYIETTPSVPLLSHVRIVSFMAFLLVVDCLFLSNSLRSLIQKREASVAIFFSFEWTNIYVNFYAKNYGVPLHLIRELYETFRNFRIRIADYVRYRKITSNMNERFPDATADELTASDATCIICREEMTSAKKLLCGHLFHVHCLRSWLERQHTCPTCRAPIIPPDNGRAAVQHVELNLEFSLKAAAGTRTPASEGVPGDNVSRRQAKLEAAASAASIYGRSFAYPPANTLNRYSDPPESTPNTSQSGEGSSSNQSQKDQALEFQNANDSSTPLPPNVHGAVGSGASTKDLENSLQLAQENFIRSQIEATGIDQLVFGGYYRQLSSLLIMMSF